MGEKKKEQKVAAGRNARPLPGPREIELRRQEGKAQILCASPDSVALLSRK